MQTAPELFDTMYLLSVDGLDVVTGLKVAVGVSTEVNGSEWFVVSVDNGLRVTETEWPVVESDDVLLGGVLTEVSCVVAADVSHKHLKTKERKKQYIRYMTFNER